MLILFENPFRNFLSRKLHHNVFIIAATDLKVGVEVEGGAGGRQDDDIAGLCGGTGQLHGVLHIVRVLDGQCGLVEAGVFPQGLFNAGAGGTHQHQILDVGLESALRTELLAHTGTGAVYVYDPAARTVEQVVGGIAGASGLTLDERTQTLYISDLGSRCIWSAAASARSLTAGGKGCQSSFSGLPGYPGALALDEDSTLYISYRWASSSWLERHAGSTFLRGVALRLSESMQENLFSLPADSIRAEAVSTASGSWLWSFSGKPQGSSSALCPVENRVYFGIAGEKALYSVRV